MPIRLISCIDASYIQKKKKTKNTRRVYNTVLLFYNNYTQNTPNHRLVVYVVVGDAKNDNIPVGRATHINKFTRVYNMYVCIYNKM